MPQLDSDRRFQLALERAHADWRIADPYRCAASAGCQVTPEGIVVPFFGRPFLVAHPGGEVTPIPHTGKPPAIAVRIVLLHYLLCADGTPMADRWLTFRELPDGMFYAQAFAGHAEEGIARKFGHLGVSALQAFRQAASELGGQPLDLADASFRFQALPRVALAVLLWAGDDEFPGRARILFDAHAGHYLPTEDLAGLGDLLAHRLIR